MTLTISDEVRAKAEIYHGDAAGQEKTRLLLHETGLPSGLLPLRDIVECGYVEETGFVWLRQRRRVDHYFAKAGRHVSYAAEVSAFADKGRLKKITGVKAKEMLIWVTLHEICVDDPPTGKLHCKAIGGLSRSFPVEAFEADDGRVVVPRAVVRRPWVDADAAAAAPAVEEEKREEAVAVAPEGEREEKVAAAAAEEAGSKDAAAANGVDGVEEKLKDLSAAAANGVAEVEEKLKDLSAAGDQVVQGEAVAAKN